MEFTYTAYTTDRGVFNDRVSAPDKTDAAAALATLGFIILKISPVRRRPQIEVLFPSFFSAGPKDLILLSRQISAMLSSGGNLMRALELAENQSRSRAMRRIIVEMRETLEGGGSLSDAMIAHPKIFDKLFVSVVQVGEFTGRLGPSLEQLADILESDQEAKAKAIKTMMYPMAIVGMSVITLGVLMTVAVPPLLLVFDQLGAETPALTRAAVSMVNFVTGNGPQVLLGGVIFFGGISTLRRIPATAAMVDNVLSRAPLYGPLTVAGDIARFSRTMSMLLAAGVAVSDALPLGISGCKNVMVRRALLAGEESMLSGHGLAVELRKHPVLPSMFMELVTMGEEGNQLPKMMADAASTFQRERDEKLGTMLAALEPLSTVVVGGIVAFIAFAMFVPIYSGLGELGG
jgi:type IV pilus assembly protein PilC